MTIHKTRRDVLALTATTAALSLAGCSGDGDTDDSAPEEGGNGDDDGAPAENQTEEETEPAENETATAEENQTEEETETEENQSADQPAENDTEAPEENQTEEETETEENQSADQSAENETGGTSEGGEDRETSEVFVVEDYRFASDDLFLYLVGTAKNVSEEVLDYAEITAFLYDEDGVRVDDTLWNATDVQPGETLSFEAAFLDTESVDQFAEYEIVTDASIYDV